MGASFGHEECEPKWQEYPYELRGGDKNRDKETIGLVLCWICGAHFEFGITEKEWKEAVKNGTALTAPQYLIPTD